MAANPSRDLAAGRSRDEADTNVLRGGRVSRFEEHDFCFAV